MTEVISHRLCRSLLSVLLLALLPHAANAQSRTHVYGFVGAGAAGLGGGVDWLIKGTPVGVGAEIGIGNLLGISYSASYHLPNPSSKPIDLFVRGGFTDFTDLNDVSRAVHVGGGVVYWPRKHIGLRFDGFSFLPVRDEINPEHRHDWGVRGGAAFRLLSFPYFVFTFRNGVVMCLNASLGDLRNDGCRGPSRLEP